MNIRYQSIIFAILTLGAIFTGCKTSLHRLAAKGDTASLQKEIQAGSQVDAPNSLGQTPLIYAAENGQLEAVKYLLAQGANVNATDIDGFTPLIVACDNRPLLIGQKIYYDQKRNHKVIQYLLENKADPNLASRGKSALIASVGLDDIEAVKLLIRYKANVNYATHRGITALKVAANRGNLEMLKLLVANKANVNDTSGNSNALITTTFDPLPIVFKGQKYGHLIENIKEKQGQAASFLLAKGADPNYTGSYGYTTLHTAILAEHLPVIKAFATSKKLNKNFIDKDKLTYLQYAQKHNKTKAVALLKEQGFK